RGVHERVQYRPVGNRVAAIQHRFSFAERRCNAPRVEMIAPDRDRRAYLTRSDEIVECNAEARAITLTQPAYPRRKSLEVNPFARELDPAREMLVLRK